mmetsp:Transcript_24261/g.33400  ORF Transcript_24261/g.33400 Transcript_24261/m.33400 type:complete len:128 (-) Transcript_24261:102-485(-)
MPLECEDLIEFLDVERDEKDLGRLPPLPVRPARGGERTEVRRAAAPSRADTTREGLLAIPKAVDCGIFTSFSSLGCVSPVVVLGVLFPLEIRMSFTEASRFISLELLRPDSGDFALLAEAGIDLRPF